ncbi:MAG TPA: histidine phosphatase family protein [Gemmatales bacterium]|nr:histidine phosphatase family protein [Gemmatales bacterium]
MSRLLLVRHAQASFFAADYDQLSDLGLEQAHVLGRHWSRHGPQPDVLVTGPRRRQHQTARAVAEHLPTGLELWELPEFDEVRLDVIISSTWEPSRSVPPELSSLVTRYREAQEPSARMRAFQQLAMAVADAWLHGHYVVPEAETWTEFAIRVRRGLDQLRGRVGRGKTVAVFTSAGPVAALLQHALHCPNPTALELVWQVYNASISELLFTQDRLTLRHFNQVAHLAEPRLLTYR